MLYIVSWYAAGFRQQAFRSLSRAIAYAEGLHNRGQESVEVATADGAVMWYC